MDRSLKARLIGASVLVLLVVLVVPELLSGRKGALPGSTQATSSGAPTRTYTIELGNAVPPPAADRRLPRPFTPNDAPLATEGPVRPQIAGSSRSENGVAQPPSTAHAPEARPPAPESATAAAPQGSAARESDTNAGSAPRDTAPAIVAGKPSRGTWSVQVGAFGSAESARKLMRQLEADGYSAYVSVIDRNGKPLHRVRVGPESARTTADALAGRLKARGLPVSLVAND